jgi:quinol monooxygenase YgiN
VIIVIARVRLRADRRDDALALLREVQDASRADDGCLSYGYHTEIADPDSLVAVEEWQDSAALEAHLRQPHVGRLIGALADFVAEPPRIVAHEVASSGPLPLP